MIPYEVCYRDGRGQRRRRVWFVGSRGELSEEAQRLGVSLVKVRRRTSPCVAQRLALGWRARAAWARQLAQQLEAAVPLDRALLSLARDAEETQAQALSVSLYQHLRARGGVAQAFTVASRVFDPSAIAMIELGHRTGRLREMFLLLAERWEEADEMASVARRAVTYPLLALGVVSGVGVFLLLVVLPRFARVFAELQLEVPALTRFYLGLSPWLHEHRGLGCGLLASLLGLGVWLYRSPEGRRRRDDWLARRSPVRDLVESFALARLFAGLATLRAAGVSAQESLVLCRRVSGNHFYDQAIEHVRRRVHGGQALAAALASTGVFPDLVVGSLRVGEATNRLEDSLMQLKRHYALMSRRLLQNRLQWLEPLLTMVLGVWVGSIAVALFYPILTLAMQVKS